MAATTRRVNLRLTDRGERTRSQKDLERAIRDGAASRFPASNSRWATIARSGSTCWGPTRTRSQQLINEFAEKVAKVPGIADMETSEKAANPALSIRLNNDAAARSGHLGAAGRRDGASAARGRDRELLARTRRHRTTRSTCSCRRTGRRLASDLGNLYLSTSKRGPDGELRMVPLRQVAEIVETTSPQIIKRQDLQRRVALYANAEGRPSGNVGDDVEKIIKATTLPPGYRFDVAGQAKDIAGIGRRRCVAALGLAIIFIYLVLASQFASFTQPIAIMASLPFTLIGVLLALLLHRHDAQHLLDDRLRHADGAGDQERDPAGRFRQPRARGGASLHDALLPGGTGALAADPDDDAQR